MLVAEIIESPGQGGVGRSSGRSLAGNMGWGSVAAEAKGSIGGMLNRTAIPQPTGKNLAAVTDRDSWKAKFEANFQSLHEAGSSRNESPGSPASGTARFLTQRLASRWVSPLPGPNDQLSQPANPKRETGRRTIDANLRNAVQAEQNSPVSTAGAKDARHFREVSRSAPSRDATQNKGTSGDTYAVSNLPVVPQPAADVGPLHAVAIPSREPSAPTEVPNTAKLYETSPDSTTRILSACYRSLPAVVVAGFCEDMTESSSAGGRLPEGDGVVRNSLDCATAAKDWPVIQLHAVPKGATSGSPFESSPRTLPIRIIAAPVSELSVKGVDEKGQGAPSMRRLSDAIQEESSWGTSWQEPTPLGRIVGVVQRTIPNQPHLPEAVYSGNGDAPARAVRSGENLFSEETVVSASAISANSATAEFPGTAFGSRLGTESTPPSARGDAGTGPMPGMPDRRRNADSVDSGLVDVALDRHAQGLPGTPLTATGVAARGSGSVAGETGNRLLETHPAAAGTRREAATPGAATWNHEGLVPNPENEASRPSHESGSLRPNDLSEKRYGGSETRLSPFEAMDGSQGTSFVTVNRTSRELSVGYRDADMGLVELRAHQDAAGVHASLVAPSAASSTSLEGQLHDLAGWLIARHTPVESLHVITAALPHARGSEEKSSGEESRGLLGGGGGSHAGQDPSSSRERISEASHARPELGGKRGSDLTNPGKSVAEQLSVGLFDSDQADVRTRPHISILV